MDSLTIILALPHKLLSPNARGHYMAKARKVKLARTDAAFQTASLLRGVKPGWKEATAKIHWFCKTKRTMDRDNALAMCKSLFDGITDAGLLTNDRGLYPDPVQFTKDAANPRVEITLIKRN